MRKYTYDHEVISMTNMFLNALADITVKRFNVHKEARDQIRTRIVYAPKQRVLADLLDKDQNLQLPVMAVQIGGFARDNSRVYNKILGTFHPHSKEPNYSYHEKTPLPVDITYNVSIMTRYQEDMDQILSHILPYLNPYFTISWRTPLRPEHEIRSNVFWNGNVNVQYPNDVTATQVARVVADLSFVFKGWIFQFIGDPVNNIHVIETNLHANSSSINPDFLLSATQADLSASSDYTTIYHVPPQPKIVDPYFALIGQAKQFNLVGAGFDKITNVYLSGPPVKYLSTEYAPFSKSTELSAVYPPFTAVKLLTSDWSYDKQSNCSFIMPPPHCPGRIDVIVEGPAGYGRLTENVKINTFNPFVSGTPEYDAFVPYQFPFLSGIEVRMEDGRPFNFTSLSGSILTDGSIGFLLQEDGFKLNLVQTLSTC